MLPTSICSLVTPSFVRECNTQVFNNLLKLQTLHLNFEIWLHYSWQFVAEYALELWLVSGHTVHVLKILQGTCYWQNIGEANLVKWWSSKFILPHYTTIIRLDFTGKWYAELCVPTCTKLLILLSKAVKWYGKVAYSTGIYPTLAQKHSCFMHLELSTSSVYNLTVRPFTIFQHLKWKDENEK